MSSQAFSQGQLGELIPIQVKLEAVSESLELIGEEGRRRAGGERGERGAKGWEFGGSPHQEHSVISWGAISFENWRTIRYLNETRLKNSKRAEGKMEGKTGGGGADGGITFLAGR